MKDPSQFTTLEELAEATAENLVQTAAGAAYTLLHDRTFRRLARLSKELDAENDFIFNELLCAHLVLMMLSLEAPDLRTRDEMANYFSALKERIPEAQLNEFRKLGTDEENVRMWGKLIRMRYDEYAGDRHSVRAAAMQLEELERELDIKGLESIQLMVPVQAVAIGCHSHVCHGKTDGRDELFEVTVKALGRFYVQYRLTLEGVRVTRWMRLRVAIARFFRRLRRL
jgi:hypothetical protein